MPKLKFVIVGPSAVKEPMVSVIPSLLKEKVLNLIYIRPSPAPFRSIDLLIIDHNTLIPNYFNDSHLLIHLAFALYPQFGYHALKKIALDYLDTKDDTKEIESDAEMIVADTYINGGSEDAIEILEETPAIFMTPKKKKVIKVKE